MMVNHLLLADFANITQEGKLNVIGLFDIVFAKNFPTVGTGLLVVQFGLEPKDRGRTFRVRFILQDSDGKTVSFAEGDLNVTNDGDLMGQNFNMLQPVNDWMTLPNEGYFRVFVEIDGNPASSVAFRVIRINT